MCLSAFAVIIMIYGIGIDNIEVNRVKKQFDEDNGFKEKIFTSKEIEYCETKANRSLNYAARFAAKEAFFKALGTGWRNGMAFNEIEVVNDDLGKPLICLYGKTKKIVEENNLTNIQVSLSHIKDFATAVIIIEK